MTAPFTLRTRHGLGNRQVGLHRAVMFAHSLDPRFKGLQTITNLDNRKALWDSLRDEMVALGGPDYRNEQGQKENPSSPTGGGADNGTIRRGKMSKKNNWMAEGSAYSKYARLLQPCTDATNDEEAIWNQVCYKELDAYKLERSISHEENPMDWWRINQKSFSLLALFWKAHSSFPATSTSSERAFSMDGLNNHHAAMQVKRKGL